MFRLFAFQVALTRIWLRAFGSTEAFDTVGYGRSRIEEKAAADAMLELDRIVLAHSAGHRERMT
jgi:hypothetical protein